ncbi:MAG: ComEA family DNA-binding protein [Desulfobacterales bacterium]|nr:ComEA family DNA-binding protein [Desulfobacterales bacterium]
MKGCKRLLMLSLVVALVIAFVPALWGEEAEKVEVGKININQASVEELTQLIHIGPKYAERIVRYREEQGPFKNPEDIINVQGIGLKTWEANKDKITIE